MLNTSNRHVPTRRVEFQNVTIQVVDRLKSNPSEQRTYKMRVSADLDQELNHAWAFGRADWDNNPWEVMSVAILHSFIDSTEQYLY